MSKIPSIKQYPLTVFLIPSNISLWHEKGLSEEQHIRRSEYRDDVTQSGVAGVLVTGSCFFPFWGTCDPDERVCSSLSGANPLGSHGIIYGALCPSVVASTAIYIRERGGSHCPGWIIRSLSFADGTDGPATCLPAVPLVAWKLVVQECSSISSSYLRSDAHFAICTLNNRPLI